MPGMRMRGTERDAYENSNFGTMKNKIPTGYRVMAINTDGTVEFYGGSNAIRQMSEDSRNYVKEQDLYCE